MTIIWPLNVSALNVLGFHVGLPDSNYTFEENLGNSPDSQEFEEFPRFLSIRGIPQIPRYLRNSPDS